MVSDAAIRALFGTNLPTFLLSKNVAGGYGPNGKNNSWEINLKEIGDLIMGGKGGMTDEYSLMSAVKFNLKQNGFGALIQMVTIPIAFRIGRRILNKPLILPANRVLKQIGLSKEVKF
jgi:hypothetical protein